MQCARSFTMTALAFDWLFVILLSNHWPIRELGLFLRFQCKKGLFSTPAFLCLLQFFPSTENWFITASKWNNLSPCYFKCTRCRDSIPFFRPRTRGKSDKRPAAIKVQDELKKIALCNSTSSIHLCTKQFKTCFRAQFNHSCFLNSSTEGRKSEKMLSDLRNLLVAAFTKFCFQLLKFRLIHLIHFIFNLLHWENIRNVKLHHVFNSVF